jgi:hypothetical protein
MSLSMGELQDASPPAALAQVIAARSSLLIIAAPVGTALGGPIVAALGARGTLLASALATVALGLISAAILAARRRGAASAGREADAIVRSAETGTSACGTRCPQATRCTTRCTCRTGWPGWAPTCPAIHGGPW